MRAVVSDEIVAAVLAAAILAAVEVIALGSPSPALVAAVAVLLLGLGLLIGAAMAISEWAVERLRPRPIAAAAIRSAAAVIPLIPLGGALFGGGFAATLPGASTAPLWVPAVGLAALIGAVWSGSRLCRGVGRVSPRAARIALAVAVVGFAVAVELANRRLFRTEYPGVHAFLIVCSCAAVAVAIRLAAGGGRLGRGSRLRWRAGVGGAVAIAMVATLGAGLRDPAARWTIATRGTHSMHLSRMARDAFDRDGDGYAAVLGGGDCDESDPAINPGAVDVPGNGIDEDCDGADAIAPDERPTALTNAERSRYLDSDEARALRDGVTAAPVILISVDALRADQLEPTEVNRGELPALFRLLDSSVWFRNAFSPSAGTDVSLSGLVTGLVDPFVEIDTTLIEAITATGRPAHAVLPREVLRWAPRTLITRGLDSVGHVINDEIQRDVGSHTTSVLTTDRALAFVDKVTRDDPAAPFFLWVHYFDVHEHAQVELSDRHLRAIEGAGDLRQTAPKYRALLRLTDREIGRLLDALAAKGIWDRAVIALLSDHGESLGEDPRLPDRHGMYVYNALTRVPLAIRAPGAPSRQVAEPVSLIDVYPTLVELLGLDPRGELAGASQFLHMLPAPPPEPHRPGRALPLNESDQWGVLVWPHKLMVRPADNLVELYDIERDPGERDNLVGRDAEVVSRLKARYHGFPTVSFDRTPAGRRWRERQARPPRRR
jgi:arylsulfatase A-like enzyme